MVTRPRRHLLNLTLLGTLPARRLPLTELIRQRHPLQRYVRDDSGRLLGQQGLLIDV